jgi:hypothetical protein
MSAGEMRINITIVTMKSKASPRISRFFGVDDPITYIPFLEEDIWMNLTDGSWTISTPFMESSCT